MGQISSGQTICTDLRGRVQRQEEPNESEHRYEHTDSEKPGAHSQRSADFREGSKGSNCRVCVLFIVNIQALTPYREKSGLQTELYNIQLRICHLDISNCMRANSGR